MPERDLADFRRAHGLEPTNAPHWRFQIGPLTVRLPNFRWRQDAIEAHDRHHVLTGYPLTMTGEIQLAAWEWGAGRYPDWRATLFCAPLIVAGIAIMPIRTWRGYRRGLSSTSLYHRRGNRRA
jgi:hypothetical protein